MDDFEFAMIFAMLLSALILMAGAGVMLGYEWGSR